ncbi:DegV family protein [Paenibacillus aurantius]|uniref:DegV family protein n=1 Tax=Paenibacillus aurantius TaxID=2918900 RepID=A0AA96LI59_9BACL|nr:DegV family protein [Paenibacillus aurantius]WJH33224.1 DegV family protein [Paenibacillus sp. CC-CFT747]WNQ13680.1 DegV family protein [Paenibacillus aurantius]
MSRIRLVTDSTADIPAEIREALGIEMVPLKVHFGTETYQDAVTLQSGPFYEKLAQSSTLPTTSQPSPVDFLETYKRLAQEPGVQIISIHLASALSGTYQSAVLAKSLLEEKADITIVDSRSASYGFGCLVVKAAEAARDGKSLEECLALIHRLRDDYGLFFLVDTLEYLQKGGRIGKAAALFGSLLNIKPILSLDEEGQVYSVDKVRGHKKAMGRIVELLKERPKLNGEVEVIIAHANAPAYAEELSALVGQHFNVKSVAYTPLGPVIGTHTGPGTVAVFMLPVL